MPWFAKELGEGDPVVDRRDERELCELTLVDRSGR
jgi:hypothetical protein